jgi:hypothetical protein
LDERDVQSPVPLLSASDGGAKEHEHVVEPLGQELVMGNIDDIKSFRYIIEYLVGELSLVNLSLYQIDMMSQALPELLVRFTERLAQTNDANGQCSMINYIRMHKE